MEAYKAAFAIPAKVPVTVPTVMLGVPVSPKALEAMVAELAIPDRFPMNVAAVNVLLMFAVPITLRANPLNKVVPIPTDPLTIAFPPWTSNFCRDDDVPIPILPVV